MCGDSNSLYQQQHHTVVTVHRVLCVVDAPAHLPHVTSALLPSYYTGSMPSRCPTRASCQNLPRYKGTATASQLVCGLRRKIIWGNSIRAAVAFVNAASGKLAAERILHRSMLARFHKALPEHLRTATGATEPALLEWIQQFEEKKRAETATGHCLFTRLEEELIAQWCTVMHSINWPVGRRDVIEHARTVALRRTDLTAADVIRIEKSSLANWWLGFRKRQAGMSERREHHAPPARLLAERNTDNINHFFDLLEQFKDLPAAQVYAGDETGLGGDGTRPAQVLVQRGTQRVKSAKTRTTSHIGIMHIGNAAGETLPPVVVFKGKFFRKEHVQGLPADSLVGMQENGHFIGMQFKQVLQHIVAHAVQARPLLFIVDGASSHISVDSVLWAQEQGLHILCLPANMTHRLQVADVSLFGPFKRYWADECAASRKERRSAGETGFTVVAEDVSPAMMRAWDRAMRPENVVAGFRRTGTFPFNREAWKDRDPSSLASLGGLPLLVSTKAELMAVDTLASLVKPHDAAVPNPPTQKAATTRAAGSTGRLNTRGGLLITSAAVVAELVAAEQKKGADAAAKAARITARAEKAKAQAAQSQPQPARRGRKRKAAEAQAEAAARDKENSDPNITDSAVGSAGTVAGTGGPPLSAGPSTQVPLSSTGGLPWVVGGPPPASAHVETPRALYPGFGLCTRTLRVR